MLIPWIAALAAFTQADAATPTEQPTEVAAVEESADDELICRRRVIDNQRVGERGQVVRVCKTRAEWNQRRPRR